MANKPPSKINSQERDKMDDLTNRRIQVVAQRYGKKTLELAYHAAFPLTITSDLLYCLRETFVQDSPWYAVADVLLSGLCQTIGYDLYEMEEDTRDALIKMLQEDENFGEQRLQDLSNFMSHYILNRFKHETNDYRREWIPLSYLMAEGKEVNTIKEQLRNLLKALPEDDEERIKWKQLETKYQDRLRQKGFEPLLLKLEPERDEESTLNDEEQAIAKAMGVELTPFDYEVAVISPTFNFNTVTVNARGEVIKTEENQAIYYVEFLGKAAGEPSELRIEMVAIPGGTFKMGSPENELGRYEDESPQHLVNIQPFFMGKYPVTQAQWRFVANLPQVNREIKLEPSHLKGDTLPVEEVSWYDAVEFCSRLSQFTGRPYTLPTEAEWEYACRAGTTTPFHFGETITSELANYNAEYTYGEGVKGTYRGKTTEVGSFRVANAFGLYDMHGNVWEWCLDDWHDNYEGAPTDGSAWFDDVVTSTALSNHNLYQKQGNAVLRGGSWFGIPKNCRSAFRNDLTRVNHYGNFGFRVVCAGGRILR